MHKATDLLPTGRGNGGSAAAVVRVSAVKIALVILSPTATVLPPPHWVMSLAIWLMSTEISAPNGQKMTWAVSPPQQ